MSWMRQQPEFPYYFLWHTCYCTTYNSVRVIALAGSAIARYCTTVRVIAVSVQMRTLPVYSVHNRLSNYLAMGINYSYEKGYYSWYWCMRKIIIHDAVVMERMQLCWSSYLLTPSQQKMQLWDGKCNDGLLLSKLYECLSRSSHSASCRDYPTQRWNPKIAACSSFIHLCLYTTDNTQIYCHYFNSNNTDTYNMHVFVSHVLLCLPPH